MLRVIQQSSVAGVQNYFSTADYYTEGQELQGFWRGRGAARLGLRGEVQQKDWNALADNANPATGERLTLRQKSKRTVGYDFNFHCSKSLSLLYALTGDTRILDAFRDSVNETMQDIEREAQTRVRKNGKDENRASGNLVWGEYVHFTARPVDGIPDPHLHAHCFVFNTTFDDKEKCWKAGQFRELKRDAPYFEAVFHSRLARRMQELGLPVVRTKTGWEIAGLADNSMLNKFSRRTALIEELAKEKGITDAAEKDGLGASTREGKAKNLAMDELRDVWKSWLSADERDAVGRVKKSIGRRAIAENQRAASEAVVLAVDHCFERASVLPERRVLTESLKRAVGSASPETIMHAFAKQGLITADRNGRRMASTRSVLAEEKRMVDFARKGRGACARLGSRSHVLKRDWLNEGQRQAVQHVLSSPDRVILIRGVAGTGKTTMMHEAVEGIEVNGKQAFIFAPSSDSSRGVLREVEKFANADTVARLLVDEKLQAEIRKQVIWIDEAGLIGTRTMAQVFDLAAKLDARVILSGDKRQHGSVERGAALRLLETEAGLVAAELLEIQRQSGQYKEAVRDLSEGRTAEGFKKLDKLEWIKEVPTTDRYKLLAKDYIAAVQMGKTALVVSPTHREKEWVNDEIRSHLKRIKRLKDGERRLQTLINLNLTEAQRRDAVNLAPGDVLVFHQNAKGYCKGQRIIVGDASLPLDQAARFQVYRPDILPVAPGDLLRITRNGFTKDGRHRLDNGTTYTVKGFKPNDDIVLENNWIVAADYGHLAHGYVVTSHASQGRTVQRVLIAESTQSFPAASREQFYVSVSRGRERATIYTDNKEALLDAVQESDERLSATELVHGGHRDMLLDRDLVAGISRGREIERERDGYER